MIAQFRWECAGALLEVLEEVLELALGGFGAAGDHGAGDEEEEGEGGADEQGVGGGGAGGDGVAGCDGDEGGEEGEEEVEDDGEAGAVGAEGGEGAGGSGADGEGVGFDVAVVGGPFAGGAPGFGVAAGAGEGAEFGDGVFPLVVGEGAGEVNFEVVLTGAAEDVGLIARGLGVSLGDGLGDEAFLDADFTGGGEKLGGG